MLAMRNLAALALLLLAGCTVVSANRTFPKLAFYWSHDAKAERAARASAKAYNQAHSQINTNH